MWLNLRKFVKNINALAVVSLFAQLLGNVTSFAVFETRILSLTNPNNMISSRECCSTGALPGPSSCLLQCRTYVEVCLDDIHLVMPSCRFGEATSGNYGKSNLDFDNTSLSRLLKISFHASWPGEFGIRLNVYDNSTSHFSPKGSVIQSLSFVDSIQPSVNWYTRNPTGSVSSLHFKYRLKCGDFYYGPNCTTYCKERNDDHGHYRCDEDGKIVCMAGWIHPRSFCKTAVCHPTCSNGRCTQPNKCSCNYGWRGKSCSVCITRSGCQNGSCSTPGDCVCNSGWGGVNCDRELDYCGMRAPCKNGAPCINLSNSKKFMCFCPTGFTGTLCEIKVTACTSNPCKNGASCHVSAGGGYTCNCTAQYTGPRCETFIDLCATFVCKNNGTCSVVGEKPTCTCIYPFAGTNCKDVRPSPSYTSLAVDSTTQSIEVRTNQTLSTRYTTFPSYTHNIASSISQKFNDSNTVTLIISRQGFFSSSSYKKIHTKRNTINNTEMQGKASAIGQSSLSSTHLQSAGIPSGDMGQKYKDKEKSNNSLVVVLSASLSILLVVIFAFILIWRKKSRSRKKHVKITVLPSSVNTPRDLIDPANENYRQCTEITMINAPQSPIHPNDAISRKSTSTSICDTPTALTEAGIADYRQFAETASKARIPNGRSIRNHRQSSVINNNNENCQCKNMEQSLDNTSDSSVFVGSKESCRVKKSSTSTTGSRQDTASTQVRKDSNCNIDGFVNHGYLSEGTSGYGSNCSSARSSANYHSKFFKSILNTSDIHVLSLQHSSHGEEIKDLPNCIVYKEETL